MAEGSRETLCSRCVHCEVCAHKATYLEATTRMNDAFFNAIRQEYSGVDFLKFRDPGCKYYKEKEQSRGMAMDILERRRLEDVLNWDIKM